MIDCKGKYFMKQMVFPVFYIKEHICVTKKMSLKVDFKVRSWHIRKESLYQGILCHCFSQTRGSLALKNLAMNVVRLLPVFSVHASVGSFSQHLSVIPLWFYVVLYQLLIYLWFDVIFIAIVSLQCMQDLWGGLHCALGYQDALNIIYSLSDVKP